MADFKDFVAGRSSASLTGTDALAVISGGVTKKTTPEAINALAAANYDSAGTAASAVAAHAAAADPHPAYALEAALGGASALNVGTGAGTVAAGDDVRLSPRSVTASIVSGVVTIDCANAPRVVVTLSLSANVTSVVYQNVPTVCTIDWYVTQSGGPWTFPQAAWPSGTVLDSTYNLYTDATISRFWWTTISSGSASILECNGPASGSVGDAYATSHEADTTAHPAANIVNTPAGNIAATNVQAAINELDAEKAATGHNHTGVYEPAGTVSTHVAASDPHTQYALEAALGGAASLNVGAAAGTVAAGNDSRFIPQASAQYVLLVRSSAGTGAWQEVTSSANVYSVLQAASYAAIKTLLSLNNVANVDQLPRTAEVATVTGNTTIDATYNGKIIDCNSASAITLTFNDSLAAGFQCYVLRRGSGTVAIARQTTGTLNGAATSISISAQWKSAFVFAYGTGAFAVDAG